MMADSRNTFNKNLDRFEDIFHQYGDDLDEDNDQYIDFDNFFTDMGATTENDDEDAILVRNMMNMEAMDKQEMLVTTTKREEEHLSQKLSQLSTCEQEKMNDEAPINTKKRPSVTPTSATSTSASMVKKFKPGEDIEPIEWISNYLSSANGSFDRMLHALLKQESKSYDIEDFRQFAMITNHLQCIELDKILWHKYLQSGTGELIQQEQIRSVLLTTLTKLPSIRYWPIEVKLRMIKRRETAATDPKDIDHESCLDYVQRVLMKYDRQKDYYQNQYRTKQQQLKSLMTDGIEDAIVTFVRQYGLSLYRICIDKLLAKIEFNYKNQLVQFEFQRERPNQYQKQLFENLFQLKRTAEEAKLDVAILKQRIAYKQLPKSFDLFRIPTSIQFDSISNNSMRRSLREQCEKILQRTTSDLMLVHIALAETRFHECEKKFDRASLEMQRNQDREDFYEKFTKKSLDILYRRLKLLDEYLMYCYNLKLRFFDKAPTVMN